MRGNMRTRTLAVLAVGATLLIAGCGGEDEEGDTSSTTSAATGATGLGGEPLTHEEFVAQGDEICATGDEEIEAAASGQFGDAGPQNEQAITEFAETVVIPSIQAQHDGISALTPPEGEEEEVEELLSELQTALDELSEDPSLLASSTAFEDVNKLASDFGFTNCGGDAG